MLASVSSSPSKYVCCVDSPGKQACTCVCVFVSRPKIRNSSNAQAQNAEPARPPITNKQVYGAGGDKGDSFKVSDTVLEVQNESTGKISELKLSHFWPVRKPRPVLEKLPGNSALTTGLRVIDTIFP